MIKRIVTNAIVKGQKDGFVNIIYGPRRVGKTVLLQQLMEQLGVKKEKLTWFNGDTEEAREALGTTAETKLSALVDKFEYVVIDEAQRIDNIGLALKIMIDKFPTKKFYVSGSSSLALSAGIQEPLTGRAIKYCLYPLSTVELTAGIEEYQKLTLLEQQLIYGGYPYLRQLTKNNEKEAYLKSIVADYLFKDVLLLADINLPETLRRLTTLLAFQVGLEVSLSGLAGKLEIDVKTVQRYLSLLKQGFVIFEVGAYSKNLRKEVVKSKKYYFWDTGIRNALIGQFMPLASRLDTGRLWENFLAVERMKRFEYKREAVDCYFWRTWDQAEIDWVEMKNGKLKAFEFKFGQDKKARTPKAFWETYGQKVKVVNKENYLDFVG